MERAGLYPGVLVVIVSFGVAGHQGGGQQGQADDAGGFLQGVTSSIYQPID
jgi:hypothetical protein